MTVKPVAIFTPDDDYLETNLKALSNYTPGKTSYVSHRSTKCLLDGKPSSVNPLNWFTSWSEDGNKEVIDYTLKRAREIKDLRVKGQISETDAKRIEKIKLLAEPAWIGVGKMIEQKRVESQIPDYEAILLKSNPKIPVPPPPPPKKEVTSKVESAGKTAEDAKAKTAPVPVPVIPVLSLADVTSSKGKLIDPSLRVVKPPKNKEGTSAPDKEKAPLEKRLFRSMSAKMEKIAANFPAASKTPIEEAKDFMHSGTDSPLDRVVIKTDAKKSVGFQAEDETSKNSESAPLSLERNHESSKKLVRTSSATMPKVTTPEDREAERLLRHTLAHRRISIVGTVQA